jgi:hypothetical protein
MSAAVPFKRSTIRSNKQGGIAMSQFIYLYRGGETGRSPEKMQQMQQKWTAWLKQLTDQGYIKDVGQPLERTGKLVKANRRR